MQNTGGNSSVLGEIDIRIDSSMKAFSTLWGDLRVAFYFDENSERQGCYLDSKGNVFKIAGKTVISRSDAKVINGKEYAPACVEGGITKYYDKDFRPLTQTGPHPSLVYGKNGEEYFIDATLSNKNTIWGNIRTVQYNHPQPAISCNHFMIDDNNQEVVNMQSMFLRSIGGQKEIDGILYQRATFADGVRRYYDAAFNPLPIVVGMEVHDDDIVDIKEIDGTMYAIRHQKKQAQDCTEEERRNDWGHVDNGVDSSRFTTSGYPMVKLKIWGSIQRGTQKYIVVISRIKVGGIDVIVYDLNLNQIGEYPIWDVFEGNIREVAIQRLDELIPKTT